MKTIVLDDDPTGTQSATGVTVLLESDADLLVTALGQADSVYVQTNSRAMPEDEAVKLARRIKADGEIAAERLGADVRFVLRGDSTLRGHVFAESEVFMEDDAVMVFLPAFPEGGRTTRGGVHYVRVGDRDIPAHESEYAQDPVFGFTTGILVDYVAEKSDREALPVSLDQVRSGQLARILADAPAQAVVLPDAVNADDISAVAQAIDAVSAAGRSIVVRSAAPLAAQLAGVASAGLLPTPLLNGNPHVLLVCGSHTAGATAQLVAVADNWGAPAVIDTVHALDDPIAAGLAGAKAAGDAFAASPVTVLTTERARSADHDTLGHGERVMSALTTAVAELLPEVDVVIAKGGITSAEVARTGIGATSAQVLGQVLPGVSVWQMTDRDQRDLLYVVVPGNVGDPDTLVRVLATLGHRATT